VTKKGNLAAALSQFDKRPAAEEEAPQPTPTPPRRTWARAAAKAAKVEEAQVRTGLPPSRQGKKALTGYFDSEVLRQLKVMAAVEETTIQTLMTEALNDLFKKHGKPHIA